MVTDVDNAAVPVLNRPLEVEPLAGIETEKKQSRRLGYRAIKRVFDVVCSALALVVLSPVFLVVAILIKREDGGPIIHRRWCVGKDGPYVMLKFRTMVPDADNLEKYLAPEQIDEYQKDIKLADDPRITRTGRPLRKASLDELPQLVNVLKGEMSLIGPRPMVKEETEFYSEYELSEILDVKPGITGYWQVNGRSDSTYESGERQNLELYYARNRSIWLDLKILAKTVSVVVRRGGAY